MTSYAHDVCFSCRKSWAPIDVKNRRYARTKLGMRETPRSCPDCKQPTIGLGLAFKPPKQSNKRAWRKLEAKAKAGDRFLKS